jgi:hypothetical protein
VEWRLVAGYYENIYELSGSIRGGEVLEYLKRLLVSQEEFSSMELDGPVENAYLPLVRL